MGPSYHEELNCMREFIVPFIQFFFSASIGYFLFANLTYLLLLVLAFIDIRKSRLKAPLLIKELKATPPAFAPAISLIAPAYNEGKSIIAAVKSFLSLNYPVFEIIVVNDGSKDDTLQQMISYFKMYPEDIFIDPRVNSKPIKGTWRSSIHPHLILVDKENGRKADANNAGVAVAKYPVICAVDSDSVLEEESLLRIALPFFEDPDLTIASGGTIRVLNGSTTKYGRVVTQRLSREPLVMYQNVEYIRAFLCGRVGWNALGATLVISGAFGLFNREAVIACGGYDHASLGEDMELIVRMHRYYGETLKRDYRIVFVPDPVCWTEVPFDWKTLGKQRVRWSRGLAETMMKNKQLFHPRYKLMGMYAMPYYFLVELLGPIIELLSWFCVGMGSYYGIINREMIAIFFLIGIVFGIFMTIMAIMIEEIYFRKESRLRELLWMTFYGCIETFGYRQINSYWRLKGLWEHFRGTASSWGEMKRKGIN